MAEQDPFRILSLIASATEILCALGFRDQLVGRSHECDFPPSVAGLPAATAPRFDIHASSREIDERVKALASGRDALRALGVYEVKQGILRELQPTHIVTQMQCEVCAVSLRDVRAAVAAEADCEARIVSLAPNTLADVWDDFRSVATALQADEEGERLVRRVLSRIDAVTLSASRAAARPTVAAIEWVDPLMAAGNWMPELIELAGGRCLFGKAGRHSPWMDFPALAAADPDVIIVCPCGFGIERAVEDMAILAAHPGWASLQAVRSGRVAVCDGNQYFNRPGPRLAETTEILAEILHPDRFRFGHCGSGWIPFNGRR